MPQYYSFEIPSEGVSREVLETDLRYYLGDDAKLVDSRRSDRYIIQTVQKPSLGMISSLRDDTSAWRRSDDYRKHRPYAGSRTHEDRKRACRGDDGAYRTPGVAPIGIPSRPALVQRYSSSSGSVFGSMQGSSYESISRTQSRRPSDAMSPIDGGAISRTTSISSDYGTSGSIGWHRDPHGTDGGYGWRSSQRRPSAYGQP